MFISFDNGAHWQSFQLNLPNVPVTDIKIHRDDLIVSTQGRAFWIIDDISSLYQLTADVTASSAHLFKPRDSYRTRVSPTNLGPIIEYYVPQGSNDPLTIEIRDAKGKTVNSYSSEAPATPTRGGRGAAAGETQPEDPDAPAAGRRFGPPPPRVTKVAGLNRVVWDLRNKEGVIVPPGQYQVILKVGVLGKAWPQPLNVLIDPRVAEDGVTVADLQEQFEHNMRMREMVASVNQLVARIRDAQTKLRNASTTDSEALNRVNAIAARLLTEPVRYSKPGLQAHITYLASMTANVDQKIGRDAIERYAMLKKELDAIRAEVDRLLGPAQPIATDR
jgi:hypothetical protein